jgi:hypothetical protein
MTALTAMRPQFPDVVGSYKVDRVIAPLGSLITGITGTDSHIPYVPPRIFLTDESRRKRSFIDVSLVQRGLAFSSLQMMKEGLRFNICSLESSYVLHV